MNIIKGFPELDKMIYSFKGVNCLLSNKVAQDLVLKGNEEERKEKVLTFFQKHSLVDLGNLIDFLPDQVSILLMYLKGRILQQIEKEVKSLDLKQIVSNFMDLELQEFKRALKKALDFEKKLEVFKISGSEKDLKGIISVKNPTQRELASEFAQTLNFLGFSGIEASSFNENTKQYTKNSGSNHFGIVLELTKTISNITCKIPIFLGVSLESPISKTLKVWVLTHFKNKKKVVYRKDRNTEKLTELDFDLVENHKDFQKDLKFRTDLTSVTAVSLLNVAKKKKTVEGKTVFPLIKELVLLSEDLFKEFKQVETAEAVEVTETAETVEVTETTETVEAIDEDFVGENFVDEDFVDEDFVDEDFTDEDLVDEDLVDEDFVDEDFVE